MTVRLDAAMRPEEAVSLAKPNLAIPAEGWGLRVPISRPGWSGGVVVFVEDAVESVSSVDVQVSDLGWLGDRFEQRRSGAG